HAEDRMKKGVSGLWIFPACSNFLSVQVRFFEHLHMEANFSPLIQRLRIINRTQGSSIGINRLELFLTLEST
ncbi:MAG TPA: hypothetical protein PL157_23025, partial [Acidobacteriota bacterium]|nr:hypothetical protein [Acidobacteriota bacterium]